VRLLKSPLELVKAPLELASQFTRLTS